jgi:outer membrane protein TolC
MRHLIDNPESLRTYTDFLIQEALRNSPQIKELDANIAGLERSLASLKRLRLVPGVGIFAQTQDVWYRGGIGSDLPGVDPADPTWSVGINFNLPLFNGMSTSHNIQKTAIEIQKLRDQRTQIQQVIETGVRNALLEITVKAVNLQSSRRSAEFANKSLELVQDAYSKGGVSLVELADSQNAKLNADVDALNSVYEFLGAMLSVEKSVGRFALLSAPEEEADFLRRLEKHLNDNKGGR